ncbi:MAG: bifunctional DNA-formamidopyrimidine glycosylase/DNA-(apurinic or apyrimidinic site) lyase [Paracoccaceae bacterium]|nr:bifunctional DNA-formamidopyrimidine glycosylase/DNA-(apurinic or apyrimidinic site) lyase [Paracoccaceae bacterium]
MPELPEVETVCSGLRPAMEGNIINKLELRRNDLRWPFPKDIADRTNGKRVIGVRRRAKYILIDLSSDQTIIIHLGMSGRILIDTTNKGIFNYNSNIFEKHDHVIFYMLNGTLITFNDARRFGAMDMAPTETLDEHWLLKRLGPEPLGNGLNAEYLSNRFKNKNTSIKTTLLDQLVVAGLGNIYVCEILFRSGVSPQKNTNKLEMKEIERLVKFTRSVLIEAIEAGGSSLKDHRQTNGELGYFQHNFLVYGREGEKCVNDNCQTIIKRVIQSGRSTFYCSKCQR